MLSNFVLSQIRTYVPVAIGALLAWLASSLHIVIDPSSQPGLVVAATGVLAGAYYALVHLLEQKWPKLGVLLGAAKLPFYAAQDASGAYNVTTLPPATVTVSGNLTSGTVTSATATYPAIGTGAAVPPTA